MATSIPGYIPGEKAHEWADVLAAKKGVVGYVPISPSTIKKEKEAEKKPTPVKK